MSKTQKEDQIWPGQEEAAGAARVAAVGKVVQVQEDAVAADLPVAAVQVLAENRPVGVGVEAGQVIAVLPLWIRKNNDGLRLWADALVTVDAGEITLVVLPANRVDKALPGLNNHPHDVKSSEVMNKLVETQSIPKTGPVAVIKTTQITRPGLNSIHYEMNHEIKDPQPP